MLKAKQSVKVLMVLLLTGSIFSCSTDENLKETDENLKESEVSIESSQFSRESIDTDKVYTITSTTVPLTLSTSGYGTISDIVPTETTVKQLWKFTPSSIDGSYYIDNVGEEVDSRLTTTRGINALTLDGTNSTGGSASWVLTPTGLGDYYFTNLSESENRRMTADTFVFSSTSYGARTTAAGNATDAERFTFTEFDLASTGNRAPITSISHASMRPFATVISNVLSNDFDPDGDELTLVSFTNNDSRVAVEMIGNSLQVSFRSRSLDIVEVTYVVSDGNGGTSTGVLRVGRNGRGNNG